MPSVKIALWRQRVKNLLCVIDHRPLGVTLQIFSQKAQHRQVSGFQSPEVNNVALQVCLFLRTASGQALTLDMLYLGTSALQLLPELHASSESLQLQHFYFATSARRSCLI